MASPEPVRNGVAWAMGLGRPERTGFSVRGDGIGLVTQRPEARPEPVIVCFMVW